MSTESKKIAVGVFCADWRLHQDSVQIENKVKELLAVDAVDVLATAGPEGVVKNPSRAIEKEALANNIKVLIGAHKPVALAFVAHQQCAGHPVSDEQHEADVAAMVQEYKDTLDFNGEIVGLVATYTNDNEWGLKEVVRT